MNSDPNPLLLHRVESLKNENEILKQNYELLSAILGGIIAAHGGEFRYKPNLSFNFKDKKLQWFEDPETMELVFQLV